MAQALNCAQTSACAEGGPRLTILGSGQHETMLTFLLLADDFVEIMGPVSTPDTARPAASAKSVLIGKVPDRGGRTDESRGTASMPAWSSRKNAPGQSAWPGRKLTCMV